MTIKNEFKQFAVDVTITSKGGTQTNTYRASIDGHEMNFVTIAKFNDDLTKINKALKKVIRAMDDGAHVTMTVSSFIWDTTKPRGEMMQDWNHWEYTGFIANDNDGLDSKHWGINLNPGDDNTRTHGIWYDFTMASLTTEY